MKNGGNNGFGWSKFKLYELILCAVAIIVGLLYLYAKIVSLSVLFPIFSVIFSAIPILKLLDERSRGNRGFVSLLPALLSAVVAVAVIIATVAYFVQSSLAN